MIILDTHSWIWWWAEKVELSRSARQQIRAADSIGIAVISCWEVGMLAAKGRIELGMELGSWVELALAANRVSLLELTPLIAVTAAELQWDNGDPADRMIVATALVHDAPIVTKDQRIRDFPPVRTIW